MLIALLAYLAVGLVAGFLAGLLGVGGGMVAVVPGEYAIAVYSPPLDEAGNSVRAQKTIEYVAEATKANVFLAK